MKTTVGQLFSFNKFKIGKFSFLYKDCFIRKISFNDDELIRGIYPAVRDRNWGTIPIQIVNTNFTQNESELCIRENVSFIEHDIQYQASIDILFTANGNLKFSFSGIANSSFLKNRIGLNLLLPIENTIGNQFNVRHSNGWKQGIFPINILPVQPIKDIQSLHWKNDCEISIDFYGDIFEMEDQRNWTDASFKIYSTPLELPFPVLIEKGVKTEQSIDINFTFPGYNEILKGVPSNKKPNNSCKIPEIGFCIPETFLSDSEKLIISLKNLNPDFIQYAIWFDDKKANVLNEILALTRKLETKIKLSIILNETIDSEIIIIFKTIIENFISRLHSLEVFNKNTFTSGKPEVYLLLKELKSLFPDLKIGGGTFAYYAELNRSEVDAENWDFISFSVCPQVHAFDNLSIVENIKGLEYTVCDAAKEYTVPIHVGPVSLKQRMNFVETESKPKSSDELNLFDERQNQIFGALWMLGCIKAAAFSNASAIFFYVPLKKGQSINTNQTDFPFLSIVKEVLKYKNQTITLPLINLPDGIDGFEICGNIWIWNYTNIVIKISFTYSIKAAQKYNFSLSDWEDCNFDSQILPESIFKLQIE